MPLVVTSAAGANGGWLRRCLLAIDDDGRPRGLFTRDARIADPRGLGVSRNDGLLFVNSGIRSRAGDRPRRCGDAR